MQDIHCTNLILILQGIIGYICGAEGLDSSGLSSSAAVSVLLFSLMSLSFLIKWVSHISSMMTVKCV